MHGAKSIKMVGMFTMSAYQISCALLRWLSYYNQTEA